MGRTILTLCLTISTLIGPLVCCCVSSAAHPSHPAEAMAVKTRKSCCETPAPAKEKPAKSHGKPLCPCKQSLADKQAGLPASGASTIQQAAGCLAASVADVLPLPLANLLPVSSRVMIDPFGERAVRSGRDILTAHHVLTC